MNAFGRDKIGSRIRVGRTKRRRQRSCRLLRVPFHLPGRKARCTFLDIIDLLLRARTPEEHLRRDGLVHIHLETLGNHIVFPKMPDLFRRTGFKRQKVADNRISDSDIMKVYLAGLPNTILFPNLQLLTGFYS